MALLKTLGTYVFSTPAGKLKLRATISNIMRFEKEMEINWYDFLNNCTKPTQIAQMFYYMQVADEAGDTIETLDDIYDAFLGDFETFQSLAPQIEEATITLMGLDYQKRIAALDAKSKPTPQKKSAV